MGFPGSSAGKESTCNSRDPSSIPGSRRSAREGIGYPLQCTWASLVAQMVKHLPTMQETWVWFLGGEDPQEKEMATRSSILAWRIPWTEEPGELQSTGSQRVGHDWVTNTHTYNLNCHPSLASQVAHWVKNSPAMQKTQETQVPSLSQEDPLEKGIATHSSILVWRIPWTEEPGELQSKGSQTTGYDWWIEHIENRVINH